MSLNEAVALVRRFEAKRPIVIEETFPLACSAAELRQFIGQSRPPVSGYIGFYWGRTTDQLKGSQNLGDHFTVSGLKLFQEMTPVMQAGQAAR